MKKIFLVFAAGIIFISCVGKKKESIITIRYSAPGFVLYDKLREQQGLEFEKKFKDIKTKFEPVIGQGYFEKIQTQIASGTEPDVYFMRDFWMPMFVEKNTLMDLTPIIESDKGFNLQDFHPQLIDSYKYNNRIYGLTGSFTTGVLYFNKNLFDKAGLKYPDWDWDWNKLFENAKKLTKINAQGVIEQFGLAFEYYDWVTLILQNGGEVFDNGKCVINSKPAKEAVEFMKKLIKEKVMPSLSDLQTSEAFQLFMTGRSAMFTGGRWYTVNFAKIKGFQWGVAPLFKGKKRFNRLDSHSWVISKNTKHPIEAWEFLKYITGVEGNKYMVDVGDSVPTHISMIKDFTRNPDNKVFTDSIPYAYPVKRVMSPKITFSQMSIIMNEEFDKYLLDKQEVEKTLSNIENRINEVIERKVL